MKKKADSRKDIQIASNFMWNWKYVVLSVSAWNQLSLMQCLLDFPEFWRFVYLYFEEDLNFHPEQLLLLLQLYEYFKPKFKENENGKWVARKRLFTTVTWWSVTKDNKVSIICKYFRKKSNYLTNSIKRGLNYLPSSSRKSRFFIFCPYEQEVGLETILSWAKFAFGLSENPKVTYLDFHLLIRKKGFNL